MVCKRECKVLCFNIEFTSKFTNSLLVVLSVRTVPCSIIPQEKSKGYGIGQVNLIVPKPIMRAPKHPHKVTFNLDWVPNELVH